MDNFNVFDSIDPDIHYVHDFQNSINSNYYPVDQFLDQVNKNSDKLTIVNYNIRSFRKNADTFLPILQKCCPQVLVLTETWFSKDYQSDIVNYNSHHITRTLQQSGGVSVFVRNDLNSSIVDQFSYVSENIEVCTVCIKGQTEVFFVISIYRPHHGTVQGFTNELELILNHDTFRNRRCFLQGDFNIRLDLNTAENASFLECMRSYHYYPVINQPTRFPSNDIGCPTLLDLMWINSLNLFNSGIVMFDILDHLPTFLQVPFSTGNHSCDSGPIKVTFRLNNDINRLIFSENVRNFDWSSTTTNDLNESVTNFTTALNRLYCKSFPLKTKTVSAKKNMNPWFTSEIEDLVRKKSTYFYMLRQGFITKIENNLFKNKVKLVILNAKKSYYNNLLTRNINNMRKTWKTINFLMNRTTNRRFLKMLIFNGIEFTETIDIANAFSEHFYSIPIQLDANVPPSNIDPCNNINFSFHSPFSLSPCFPDEISYIIGNLKVTKENKNSIPIRQLVANKDALSPTICNLVNLSMLGGIFPDSLKIAKIIPIFKNGDSSEPSNYRPISLLPFMSKILERVIYTRLVNYLGNSSLISAHQFGFQRGLSTLDAIISFTEILYEGLNDKKSSLNVFIDYSKAFDTVNHSILLNKLKKYGILGTAHKLLTSFLYNRKQYVSFSNATSDVKTINIGVAQGSILGPLLFLLFMNDLPQLSNHFRPTMFADDCVLQFSNSNLSNLVETCNNELSLFKDWSDSNRLTINLDKTNCMLVSNVENDLSNHNSRRHEQPVKIIEDTKFFGVRIDCRLRFNLNILFVARSAYLYM